MDNWKWTNHWLMEALNASLLSRDPSTKCGAVIVRPNNTIVSTGFNGFATSMEDYVGDYENREIKYKKIIHAEMNALMFALEDINGCSMYTWPGLTCERCAVHIIQRGITKVVGPIPKDNHWKEATMLAHEYYEDADVTVLQIGQDHMKEIIDERTSIYKELRG